MDKKKIEIQKKDGVSDIFLPLTMSLCIILYKDTIFPLGPVILSLLQVLVPKQNNPSSLNVPKEQTT